MTDLGRLVGGEWGLVCGTHLIRKDDGLYLGDDGLVMPSVFTLEQFKAFCDWHPTFEWEAITSVFTNDDGTLDTGALEELDSRSAAAGVLVRCILGIADAEYLQAWEQQCAIDEVQTKIREITALKAMTIAEIQYRDGRLKELSLELARLRQAVAGLGPASPACDASTKPMPLTTGNIAFCFAGLKDWDEQRWKRELGSPDVWLKNCQHTPGTRGKGGLESTWLPITIGDALVRRFNVKVTSVRGRFQYCSHEFQCELKRFEMKSSMSRKGNCWDNAPTESLWGRLKVGRLYGRKFATRREAKDEVMDWLNFYNHKRLHSTLGYVSPMTFEQRWTAAQQQDTKSA